MPKKTLTKPFPFRVSLIGAETMLGKDVVETLRTRSKGVQVTTYSASGEGTFGEQEGEAIYIEPFSSQSAAMENMIVLAGSESGALKAYALLDQVRTKPVIVDALGLPGAGPAGRLISTLSGEVSPQPGEIVTLAHPVASALTLLFGRLMKYQPIVRAVVNVLEPASERGHRGINELHKQTSALLAFKPLPKEVFDAQLAFNTLSRLGDDATLKLDEIERRIYDQTMKLAKQFNTQSAVAQMSLRLIQAPVFHGYSLSVFAEFGSKADRRQIEEALACAQMEVRSLGEETPDSVGAAAGSGLIAGDIRVDTANSKAVWIWVVFDNLRLQADAVADLVAEMRQEPD